MGSCVVKGAGRRRKAPNTQPTKSHNSSLLVFPTPTRLHWVVEGGCQRHGGLVKQVGGLDSETGSRLRLLGVGVGNDMKLPSFK